MENKENIRYEALKKKIEHLEKIVKNIVDELKLAEILSDMGVKRVYDVK